MREVVHMKVDRSLIRNGANDDGNPSNQYEMHWDLMEMTACRDVLKLPCVIRCVIRLGSNINKSWATSLALTLNYFTFAK